MRMKPTTPSLFFSKNDPKDLRLGDLVLPGEEKNLNSSSASWVLLGYPDDEGIRLNEGRPGAALGPDRIRKFFYKMTPFKIPTKKFPLLIDLGNLIEEGPLAFRHEQALGGAKQIFNSHHRLLTLGGGHDYGFPDSAAFVEFCLEKLPHRRPLVLNFDAHLDVRPPQKGFHSGTPFFRLLDKYSSQIDFVEVGIQPQCNSPQHRKWALDRGAHIIPLSTVEADGLQLALQTVLAPLNAPNLPASSPNSPANFPASSPANSEIQSPPLGVSFLEKPPLWISLDIDSFNNSEAPGCSQSFATGLKISELIKVIPYLLSCFNLKGLGIYEVSPPLDQDDRTSRLAALILYHFLFPEQETP